MVRDTKGKGGIGQLPGLVWWWQGVLAGYIDFTNPEAVNWWRVKLNFLKNTLFKHCIFYTDNYAVDL